MYSDVNEGTVYLGVPRTRESSKGKSSATESKLAGSPDYYQGIDTARFGSSLVCEKCASPLVFVLQVYAPVDEAKDRTLYIFGCNDERCKGLATWRAVRCQVTANADLSAKGTGEETSATVSSNSQDLWNLDTVEVELDEIEALLQSRETSVETPKLSSVVEDAKDEKPSCVGDSSVSVYLDVVEEPYRDLTAETKQRYKKYETEVAGDVDGSTGGLQSEKYEEGTKEELALEAFQDKLQLLPNQCLRYAYSGSPLWPIPQEKLAVAPCEACGAPREFELQVLPSVLYLSNGAFGNMDWSSVLIYSCSQSCDKGCLEQAFVLRPI